MRISGTSRLSYGRRTFLQQAGVLIPAGAAFLAGCGGPKPVVTRVGIALAAAADVNPDARGRASPLTVRVYALKASSAFDAAEFFALFEKDQATLGADLIQKEEILLRPGESKKLDWTLGADIKAMAFMGAYRDLDRARWRAVQAVEPGKPLQLSATFAARQVRVEAVK